MAENDRLRKIDNIIEPQAVLEGAGVRLKRSIAIRQLNYVDPFLLFDHFGSHNPEDYLAGFPMHPHRGIETVTYMKAGSVRHTDSLGNAGEIFAGDVQWMTSGGGIMHEEMPQEGPGGHMEGFQLWVNLPAKLKMSKPRYQEIPAVAIPTVEPEEGVNIKVIAGLYGDINGPVTEIAADPAYLDVALEAERKFSFKIDADHTVIAYVYEGEGLFCGSKVESLKMLVFGEGEKIEVTAGGSGIKFLLISGRPLGEPIARYGPFVMNTEEEIRQALADLRNGTFVQPAN